jgi:hypothetical protein
MTNILYTSHQDDTISVVTDTIDTPPAKNQDTPASFFI